MSRPCTISGGDLTYHAIRGVNPPPHVQIRKQVHPDHFVQVDVRTSPTVGVDEVAPGSVSARRFEVTPEIVPDMSPREFVQGVRVLIQRHPESRSWKSDSIQTAIAGWWDSPLDEMLVQFEDDVFARQVHALAPRIAGRIWNIDDSALTHWQIRSAVVDMLRPRRDMWDARWDGSLVYPDRTKLAAQRLNVDEGELFLLVSNADILASLSGVDGDTSFVSDFLGVPPTLKVARSAHVQMPERFMSLADEAIKRGLKSFYSVMSYVGSQGALSASEHPYPVTHASIQYRLWHDEHFLGTHIGNRIAMPSMPEFLG